MSAYLAHMMKILNSRTGISGGLAPNTGANLNNARPLLVVHSGNTTTGPRALFRISSRERIALEEEGSTPNGGAHPVTDSILKSDTSQNPMIGLRECGVDIVGSETFADPVPVPLPVDRSGGLVESLCTRAGGFTTGRTNVGLNLNVSQRISKYETQLEMMRSPAFGFQGSVRLFFPVRLDFTVVRPRDVVQPYKLTLVFGVSH